MSGPAPYLIRGASPDPVTQDDHVRSGDLIITERVKVSVGVGFEMVSVILTE